MQLTGGHDRGKEGDKSIHRNKTLTLTDKEQLISHSLKDNKAFDEWY